MPLRILLVEDVEDMRYLVRANLQRAEGFVVVGEAEDGAQALACLQAAEVDVVVLDLGLPDMRGHELVPLIRAASSARIVVFTGSDADVEELASQVDGFVRKSGDMKPLVHLLSNLGQAGPQAAALALAMDATAARAARSFVGSHLVAWGCIDVLDEAQLIVSELVTNAVVHAGSHPHLLLSMRDEVLRMEVVDDSLDRPTVRSADIWDEHGRGMFIVDALASAWGVDVTERGKRVWLELPCIAPAAA